MATSIRISDLSESTNNVFGLRDAEKYRCRVASYSQGHSVLQLRLINDEAPEESAHELYLTFEPVLYFEGPMWWTSANFRKSKFEEYFGLMQRLQSDDEITTFSAAEIELLSQTTNFPGRLLVVNTRHFEVKIIADFASITSELDESLT